MTEQGCKSTFKYLKGHQTEEEQDLFSFISEQEYGIMDLNYRKAFWLNVRERLKKAVPQRDQLLRGDENQNASGEMSCTSQTLMLFNKIG